jgi:hypothetical protein
MLVSRKWWTTHRTSGKRHQYRPRLDELEERNLLTVPITVFIPEVLQLTNPDGLGGGEGDYYVKVTIGNGPEHSTSDHDIESAHLYPNWTFTDLVTPPTDGGPIKIKIELWDSDPGLDDHIDINPGGVTASY